MRLDQFKRNAGIAGMGIYVPEKVMSNADLEKLVDTSDEWIKTRTGIEERRIVAEGQYTSDIAANAAVNALKDADMSPEEVDLIIVATITPDMYSPSTACVVQHKIGAVNAAAFDINAACSGFVYGLTVARQFIETGYYKNALIIGADSLSKITDWTDRNTCVLFGDGAGAAVLKPVEKGYGILATNMGADGSIGKHLTIPNIALEPQELEKRNPENPRTIWMDGTEVFKFAVKIMADATVKVLNDAGLQIENVDAIVPHQANIRIIDGAAKKLKVSKDKIFTNLQKYGNTSAASVPLALYEAYKAGMIKKDNVVVIVGFGGGLTWGSAVMKWCKD